MSWVVSMPGTAAADTVTAPPVKCTAAATVPHRHTAHRASAPACRRPGLVTVNKNINAAPSHIVNAMYAGAAAFMRLSCMNCGHLWNAPLRHSGYSRYFCFGAYHWKITASFSASSLAVSCSGRAVHMTIIAPKAALSFTAQLRLAGHQAMKSGRPKKLPNRWETVSYTHLTLPTIA